MLVMNYEQVVIKRILCKTDLIIILWEKHILGVKR